jgi:hypothetical protein
MIFRSNGLMFRLFTGLEASWNAFNHLIEEAFVEERHGISISVRDWRNHPV